MTKNLQVVKYMTSIKYEVPVQIVMPVSFQPFTSASSRQMYAERRDGVEQTKN